MRVRGISAFLTGIALVLTPARLLSAGPPPRGGTIFVTAANASPGDDTSTQVAIAAVSASLGAKGFVFLDDPGHAAYLADVTVSRTDVGTGQERVPAGRPAVMGTGVSVPFSTGQTRLVPLERTELRIRIHRRGEPQAVWSGAAVTVRSAGARDGRADTVASALGAAALGAYPRQSAEVVGVP